MHRSVRIPYRFIHYLYLVKHDHFLFQPFPVLQTEGFDLLPLNFDDAADLHLLRADTNIMRYIPRTRSESVEDAKKLIQKSIDLLKEGNNISWAVKPKGEKRLIGTAGFYRIQWENHRGEIGYLLHSGFQGRGIMNEVVNRLLQFGFEILNFHSIEAVIDPHNTKSENLLLRNHFVKEAHIRENVFFEGQYLDSVVYSLLRRNWEK